ncbi:hypothetical protein C8R45DRAFT_924244 [Mycena sanguinolenta]|nr:hypothetical protein C8R45DRAFT_924244 [Mycena sanguinolenta]
MTSTVLELILEADDKKIPTENLCHVASCCGWAQKSLLQIKFRLKAALRGHLQLCTSTSVETRLNIEHKPLDSIKIYRKPLRIYILTLPKRKRAKREEQAKVNDLACRVEQLVKLGLTAKDFDLNILKQPDRVENKELSLDPSLKGVLVYPDGVTFPPDAARSVLRAASLVLGKQAVSGSGCDEQKDLIVIEETMITRCRGFFKFKRKIKIWFLRVPNNVRSLVDKHYKL